MAVVVVVVEVQHTTTCWYNSHDQQSKICVQIAWTVNTVHHVTCPPPTNTVETVTGRVPVETGERPVNLAGGGGGWVVLTTTPSTQLHSERHPAITHSAQCTVQSCHGVNRIQKTKYCDQLECTD